jgi:hypothetical protein
MRGCAVEGDRGYTWAAAAVLGRLAPNAPPRIIGVHHWHCGPQRLVGRPDHASCAPQGVLREGILGQLHHRQNVQYRWDLRHGDPHRIVQRTAAAITRGSMRWVVAALWSGATAGC